MELVAEGNAEETEISELSWGDDWDVDEDDGYEIGVDVQSSSGMLFVALSRMG